MAVPLLSPAPAAVRPRHVVFVAWRGLGDPGAGGSELLVDRLASGMAERGHRVTLLAGGRTGTEGARYTEVRTGGRYSQYLRAPAVFRRRVGACDLVVEVCNGMPFLTPWWAGRPATLCLVNHLHTEMWPLTFPAPVAAAGRLLESRVMPWAHRGNLLLTVSRSTADSLAGLGVDRRRIRTLHNGVTLPAQVAEPGRSPLFVAVGRLTGYKRLDLLLRMWERVRPVVGGELVIVGDGPDRARLEALAGPGVRFTGRIDEAAKDRLLGRAWLLLHPALVEGWGLVVAEAAARGVPALGFDVPGLRDSIVDGRTGVLARTESAFVSAWAALALDTARRTALGRAARSRAATLRWDVAVDRFAAVAGEATAAKRVTAGGTSPW